MLFRNVIFSMNNMKRDKIKNSLQIDIYIFYVQ